MNYVKMVMLNVPLNEVMRYVYCFPAIRANFFKVSSNTPGYCISIYFLYSIVEVNNLFLATENPLKTRRRISGNIMQKWVWRLVPQIYRIIDSASLIDVWWQLLLCGLPEWNSDNGSRPVSDTIDCPLASGINCSWMTWSEIEHHNSQRGLVIESSYQN